MEKTMMRTLMAGFLAVSVAALAGCNNEGVPGGPGATNTPPSAQTTPTVTQNENTFKLNTPLMSTSVDQGESKEVAIGIDRGKNFEEDVVLGFSDEPKGVTIDPVDPTIKHGDKEAKVNIKAAPDAALGDFTVKVKGHPTKGPDAISDLKITVAKK
jgi:hypothetical protein